MRLNTKLMVYISLLASLATVLMFFPHFPILGAFPFLKIDFSDVPALFAAVTISPLCAVIIELIKNLIHSLATDTGFVGELSNFIVGTSFALSAGILSKHCMKNMLMKKKLIFVLILSSVIQIVFSALSNYFVIAPMYFGHDNTQIARFVIYGSLPFNAIKDVIQSVTFYILYRAIYPYIKKNMYLFK